MPPAPTLGRGGSLHDEGTEAAQPRARCTVSSRQPGRRDGAHHVGAALAADADADTARPSWAFLAALGLIGGGPTFVGAAVGHGFTSKPVSVVFLTLAAGSILYVITQLITVGAKAKRTDLLAYGLLAGLLAGFATDAVVTVAGV